MNVSLIALEKAMNRSDILATEFTYVTQLYSIMLAES